MTETAKDAKQAGATKPYRFFSRPADQSLTAYKEWIRGTYEALMTQASLPVKKDDMTEDEWVSSWRNFWNGPEKESGQEWDDARLP